jgi:low temperature requirement protein LtrA
LTWQGTGESALLLLVVWWSWNYTTWVTNELDPDSFVVRLLMIGLTLASLLMAVAIPQAFGDRALLFVCSYMAIQIGRHSFLTFAAAGPGTLERERAGRILTWFFAAGVFWVAGALTGGSARVALWLIALALDYAAPFVLYYVPGRKRLADTAWEVETSHFSERFGLFVIIALGESIVLIGATTSDLPLDATRVLALSVAFLAAAALWWLYFARTLVLAQRELERAAHRTTVARDAYTYLHVVLVAGIILSAVGDELVIAHPRDALTHAEAAAVVAGPVVYLLAHTLIRLRLTGRVSTRRLGGAVACLVAGIAAASAPALVLSALMLVVLVAIVSVDELVARTAIPDPAELPDT